MDQLPIKIKIYDYWKPHLRALLFLFFFSLPHQTSFLLCKCWFEEVNFTRRCSHDGWDFYLEFETYIMVIFLIITTLSQFDTSFPIQFHSKHFVESHQVRAIESWICTQSFFFIRPFILTFPWHLTYSFSIKHVEPFGYLNQYEHKQWTLIHVARCPVYRKNTKCFGN